MKNGYYLSIYTCINELSYFYKIPLRHDHNMALWKVEKETVSLVHFWEFERITGIKKHDRSFCSLEDAKRFINGCLSRYGLTLDDMIEVWGTPGLSTEGEHYINKSEICLHSMYHLYSSLLSNTDNVKSENIIALALDAGPDNVEEKDAFFKCFYGGACVKDGVINMFSINSPACMWAQMSSATGLEEGTLMALGSATTTKLTDESMFRIDFSIKNIQDTYRSGKYISNLLEYVNQLSEKNLGCEITDWDSNFNLFENRVSIAVKVLQRQSVNLVINQIEDIVHRYEMDTQDTILCMSGGYALNCPTNTALMKYFNFKGFMAVPCVSDCGISLGMGLFYFMRKKSNFNFRFDSAFYGNDDLEISNALIEYSHYISNVTEFNKRIFVEDVMLEPIVWFYENAEIGPRALGHRSILGDPRKEEVKDKLNDIKLRQWWRPVAPMIMEEHLEEWFEDEYESKYMLMTHKIREDKRDRVPSIVHIDGTARVQTVSQNNKEIYELIKIFYENTGIPILCNTSLNDKGEPIIDSVSQMFNFVLRKHIKVAYVNGIRIEFKNFETYKESSPKKRYEWYINTVDEKDINPYMLTKDEIEYYVYNPQLYVYDIKQYDDVKQLKAIIKQLSGK